MLFSLLSATHLAQLDPVHLIRKRQKVTAKHGDVTTEKCMKIPTRPCIYFSLVTFPYSDGYILIPSLKLNSGKMENKKKQKNENGNKTRLHLST